MMIQIYTEPSWAWVVWFAGWLAGWLRVWRNFREEIGLRDFATSQSASPVAILLNLVVLFSRALLLLLLLIELIMDSFHIFLFFFQLLLSVSTTKTRWIWPSCRPANQPDRSKGNFFFIFLRMRDPIISRILNEPKHSAGRPAGRGG